jgi:hypothetical protein
MGESDLQGWAIPPGPDRYERGMKVEEILMRWCFDPDRGEDPIPPLAIRRAWCARSSWALYTTEFHASLAALLSALGVGSVVEPAAGRGLLHRPMVQRHGIRWTCYDAWPPERSPWVEFGVGASYARGMLSGGGAGAIFASWLPMDELFDCVLAELARDLCVPLIIVGEHGECTGSERFYMDYLLNWTSFGGMQRVDPEKLVPGFRDVAWWPIGPTDYTVVLVPT